MTKKQKKNLRMIVVSGAIYAGVIVLCMLTDLEALMGKVPGILTELVLYLIPYAIVSRSIFRNAISNIRGRNVFDENLLMLVATVGALGTGEFSEAVAVMLFYQVGELFQDIAVNRSRQSVSALMDIMPEYANLLRGDEIMEVDPDDVLTGETIVIKPGERVPLDCRVIRGSSMMDTSALTGESVPRRISEGDEVISGCINGEGVIYAEVLRVYDDSTVARILELVETASEKKAPTEQFITRFARYYTPAVVCAALALAVIPSVISGDLMTWLYRACTFLVVSCPCALVISVPMSFFGGIGAASRQGILVKGSNYLEQMAKLDTVVFDKTGTLTRGEFSLAQIHAAEGFEEDVLLRMAAAAEAYSNHPAAAAVCKAYRERAGADEVCTVSDVTETAGHGISAVVDGRLVRVGNRKLMELADIDTGSVSESIPGGTLVFVGLDEMFMGYLVISDSIKEDTPAAIAGLKKLGVRNTVMLTGDRTETAGAVAEACGIDTFYAELLPGDKVRKVEELMEISEASGRKGRLAFAGDGINDAPVLMRSDIGIAMGSMGSDAAIEAADVVLMDDNIRKIPLAMKIGSKTMAIVWQNIVFALGIKLGVLAFAAFGMANMWAAVFADVGVAVIAILNAMRALYIKEDKF